MDKKKDSYCAISLCVICNKDEYDFFNSFIDGSKEYCEAQKVI